MSRINRLSDAQTAIIKSDAREMLLKITHKSTIIMRRERESVI